MILAALLDQDFPDGLLDALSLSDPAALNSIALGMKEHESYCTEGVTCSVYSLLDAAILMRFGPVTYSYAMSDDRDFSIMRSELQRWKNYRSVTQGENT